MRLVAVWHGKSSATAAASAGSSCQSTEGTRIPFDIFVDQEMETLSVSSTIVSQQFVDRFKEGLEVSWKSMPRESWHSLSN
jgi:hypothetical protein